MTRNLALVLVVGLLLIAGLSGWAIVNTVRGVAAGPATMTGGLDTQARQVAQQQIEQGALEDGILKLAQDNASSYLERLLRSLGFKSVVFVQATPGPVTTPMLELTPAGQ